MEVRIMELAMKSTIAALTLTILVAATFTPAAAATRGRHESNWSWQHAGSVDYTQSGPNHTGPSFRGYPLSDWYIY
jgi:hypothetical protein